MGEVRRVSQSLFLFYGFGRFSSASKVKRSPALEIFRYGIESKYAVMAILASSMVGAETINNPKVVRLPPSTL